MKTRAAVAFEAKQPLEIVELDLEGLGHAFAVPEEHAGLGVPAVGLGADVGGAIHHVGAVEDGELLVEGLAAVAQGADLATQVLWR